jgi:hypothetical protein
LHKWLIFKGGKKQKGWPQAANLFFTVLPPGATGTL